MSLVSELLQSNISAFFEDFHSEYVKHDSISGVIEFVNQMQNSSMTTPTYVTLSRRQ